MTDDDTLKAQLLDKAAGEVEHLLDALSLRLPMDESQLALLATVLQLAWGAGYMAALAAAEEKHGRGLLGADDMADIAADYVAREFAGDVDLGPEPVSKRAARGEAVDAAVRFARAHREHVAPAHEPAAIERDERRRAE